MQLNQIRNKMRIWIAISSGIIKTTKRRICHQPVPMKGTKSSTVTSTPISAKTSTAANLDSSSLLHSTPSISNSTADTFPHSLPVSGFFSFNVTHAFTNFLHVLLPHKLDSLSFVVGHWYSRNLDFEFKANRFLKWVLELHGGKGVGTGLKAIDAGEGGEWFGLSSWYWW